MQKPVAVIGIAVLAGAGLASCGSSGVSTPPRSSGAATSRAPGTPAPAPAPKAPIAGEVSPKGDIPDNQAYVTFAPPGGVFSLKVPEGWARASAGGAVTFTDKLNTVRVQSHPSATPPSIRSARTTDVPALARSVRGYRSGTVAQVTRPAGTAIVVKYSAWSVPDAVTLRTHWDAVERYVFFRNGTEVILTLSGPKGADNVDPWRIISSSLRWHR